MSISKKIRFEVFKRDSFACAYCGKAPPQVILEVDHISPVSKGGNDEINNLITACFDCNRGKKNIPLAKIPPKLSENLEVLKEKEEQIKQYESFIKKIQKRQRKEMQEVIDIFQEAFPGITLTETFIQVSLRNFFNLLPKHKIIEAMRKSISKFYDKKDSAIKYFCGVCWGMHRRNEI